jgi:trk system potassium uptake protein TrkH
MLLASFNFALHFYAWRNRSLSHYRNNGELIFFLRALAWVGGIIVLTLWLTNTYSFGGAVRYGIFELVSIVTSTGFGIADFSIWPMFVPILLFVVAYMGGCAGSTTGGIKVIRTQLLFAQASHEIRRLIYPNAILQVKLGKQVISERVLSSVWGFLAVYGLTTIVISLVLMTTGLDPISAISATGFCLNNTGVGMGAVSSNFAGITDFAKWLLGLTMLLGRLEIFTLLVLFSPSFWRG